MLLNFRPRKHYNVHVFPVIWWTWTWTWPIIQWRKKYKTHNRPSNVIRRSQSASTTPKLAHESFFPRKAKGKMSITKNLWTKALQLHTPRNFQFPHNISKDLITYQSTKDSWNPAYFYQVLNKYYVWIIQYISEKKLRNFFSQGFLCNKV